MTPVLFLALSLAGGVGAALRLVVDGSVKTRVKTALPVGTLLINVSGSLVLGFVTELALGGILDESWRLIIGTGLCGGFTTFSTASFETVRLVQERRYALASVNAIGMLVAAVAAGLGGILLARLVG
ncbi:Putative fluoride ion transporter CrcB [Microbacterium oleivorans]|uniref:fluoride efflux transporter CrcB n=1 Tax=Microbacterium oleivorans TaxID=273677 RepID=UPI000976FFB1|nr:fluoride efflux transporter CrcB [Microbacterium oleivorans]AZS45039.1 Putative fluoride ion transporter CrcB [Microbacterium oleivorans]